MGTPEESHTCTRAKMRSGRGEATPVDAAASGPNCEDAFRITCSEKRLVNVFGLVTQPTYGCLD